MKLLIAKLTVLCSICIMLCNGCKNPVVEHKGTLDIKNATNTSIPVPDLKSHKPFDVEVYGQTYMSGMTYNISYYQQEGDSLKGHGAMYGDSTTVYNKADYNWTNDTVHIRLFSDSTKKEAKFKLYGKGGSNSMAEDK